jgi:GT2 family glycosyltransferase
MKNEIISIIIPVKEINDYILEFVPKILNQKNKDFEIIILPDEKPKEIGPELRNKKIRIIATGSAGPAYKRDIGAEKSRGEILSFIDDDAYPFDENWLGKAKNNFQKESIAAVGGPQLTPKESSFFQKLSGKVLESPMVSGPVSFRHKSSEKKECYDIPSCNLFVRNKIFKKIGGFDTSFWPGEDTKLCLDIKKLGEKMVYDPEMKVYHHRRKDIWKYLKQIWQYSSHRGFFAKKYPETSFKLSYFVPSLFVLGLIFGPILSFFHFVFEIIYLVILGIYLILMFIESFTTKRISWIVPFLVVGFLTHITYGFGFLRGLLKLNLKSKYRK